MTDLRQAAQAALETVEVLSAAENISWVQQRAEIEVEHLRTALEQPEQEPIGWLDGDETLAEFMHRDLKAAHDKCGSATPREFTIPVYLAPPAAQPEQRKPLTDEQIKTALRLKSCEGYRSLVRRIEAAHGIKEGA